MLPLRENYARTRAILIHMSQNFRNRHEGTAFFLMKLLPLFLAFALWCVLILKEQYYLNKIEDLSIFLFDKQFILEWFKTPGGVLGLAGAFFTQFLHLPWLGALIWVGMLILAYYLTVLVLRIPESYRPLALLPVAMLVIGNMSLGYGVYIMREQDHFFAPVLGYMVSLIPLVMTGRIRTIWGKLLFLTAWTVIGFSLTGTFALIGSIAFALNSLARPELLRKERFTISASAIALVILVPMVIYPLYTSYRLADSWTIGLPSISDDAWTRHIRAPFQLAMLCMLLLTVVSPKLTAKKPAARPWILQAAVYLIAIVAVWTTWCKDDNFHTELAMSQSVDNYDWNRTVEIFSKAEKSHSKSDARAYAARSKKIASVHTNDEIQDIVDNYSIRFFEPTRTMVMYRDLALLKLNKALDHAFTMKDGGRLQKSRTQIPMAFQSGKQFYLQYGLVNMCYRWCLEDVIEHNWSYSTLKYMAMHSIIMQEGELAEKYINKLEKTIFYRRWARSQRALQYDREAMASAQPYKDILPYMCFENQMSNDMVRTEAYLINHFLDKEPESATPEYDRAALFFAMRIQNIPRFWERLYNYTSSNDFKVMPRSVQEAALLYSSLEKDGRQLPYDDKVKESYDAFNKYVQTHPIRIMKESEYPYCQKFGKTFYYFYYFVRNLQIY